MNKFSVSLLAILAILVSFLLFFDSIAFFYINHFTGLSVSYSGERGNILKGMEIDDLVANVRGGKIGFFSNKAFFNTRVAESIAARRLIVDCDMTEAKFIPMGGPGAKKTDSRNIFEIPFAPEQVYQHISFVFLKDKNSFEILDFKAHSKDVKIEGRCAFFQDKNDIDINIKISFSPEISATFPEDVKDGSLFPDQDGWLSTVISYKGNALMLKALYSLTV